jgi:hypothetical protein
MIMDGLFHCYFAEFDLSTDYKEDFIVCSTDRDNLIEYYDKNLREKTKEPLARNSTESDYYWGHDRNHYCIKPIKMV